MKLSTKVLLFTCVATFVGGATSTELSNTRNLRKKNVSPKKTKSQQTSDQDGNCVLLLRDTQYEDHHETTEVACALEDGTIVEIRDKDASEDFKDKMKKGQFKSGEMEIQGCQFEVDNKGVVECGVPPKKKLSLQARKHNQRKLTTLGSPSVLVVKVIANNGATTSTEATLSNSVFGNNGDPVNLSSQYSACSSNQLNFGEAPDATMTTQSPETGETNISNGAVTVSVDLSTGVGDGTMVNAVLSKLQTNFGVNANNLADYVMVCLPPNTMSGIAYAYLNSYLSVYSDSWCQYVSAQMHEIGHNLGLGHSGEGSLEYGDQSGMMGYSYGYSDAPVMCFNPAKNWQLGWYADKTVTLSISGENFIDVLGGIADYSTSSNKVIVKIIGSGTVDYYIGFNARRGANIGTQEAWDMVTVVTAGRTSTPKSTLVAKLGAGGNYNIGSQASVTVESIDSGSGTASVKICVGPCPTTNTQSPTVSPATAQPTNAPTAPPTATPTTAQPSNTPTAKPTNTPTDQPTNAPTDQPTNAPTEQPTNAPTDQPTNAPTDQPVATPTAPPVATPTVQPTKTPTESPTTAQPTNTPTTKPTVTPTAQPTANPTATPTTDQPTGSPTANPTATPTTDQPTKIPTANPTIAPATAQPTALSVYNYKGFLKPLDLGGIFKSIDDLPFCPNYKGNKLWTVKKGKVRLRIRIRDEANASRLLRVTNDNDLPPPRVVRMFPYEENNIFDLGKAATHGRQLKKQVNLASTIPVGEIMTYKSKNKKDNSQVGVWVYRLNFGKKGSLKAFRKQLRKGCYAIEIEVPLSNDGSSEMVYGDILIT